ncbi:DUF4180 domain-containing protein [Phenylobacterium sp.]|uniref:DUF4180 domain-containing protein n=1 Tax=Phenylobacterium sp. TaxID=1871053 RepID=UPI0011FF7C67|nr:DUF4180 domain-containing protein [Phenylobacterium sp.]THD54194.1 MAG: DUF4180 domain-containing protein [Phenylobacterium sp.]
MAVHMIAGHAVFACVEEGPCLADDRALSDLIGELFSSGARLAAIPLARLGPDFPRLSTGVAGYVLQKLVNYRFQIAVLGDVSAVAANSEPLRDFIRESNRSKTVWFVEDLAALEGKLVGG